MAFLADGERPPGALRPESELRYQVEALCDRVAADLLDRTGTELTIPQFAELSRKLHERIGDLVSDLCRGVPVASVDRLGDGAALGDERDRNGLSPGSERAR